MYNKKIKQEINFLAMKISFAQDKRVEVDMNNFDYWVKKFDYWIKKIEDLLDLQKQEFKRIVKEVKEVNESNGRYNACQEILKKL